MTVGVGPIIIDCSCFSAVDDHREHVKTMQSIRLRASHLMKLDVIDRLV